VHCHEFVPPALAPGRFHVYKYIYVRMYVYVYIHIYICTYMYIYVYVYIYIHTHVCIYVCVRAWWVGGWVRVFVCLFGRVCVCGGGGMEERKHEQENIKKAHTRMRTLASVSS